MIYITNLSVKVPGYMSNPFVALPRDDSRRTYGNYLADHLTDLGVTEPGTYKLLWLDSDSSHGSAQVVELVVDLERVPLKIVSAFASRDSLDGNR